MAQTREPSFLSPEPQSKTKNKKSLYPKPQTPKIKLEIPRRHHAVRTYSSFSLLASLEVSDAKVYEP